MKYATTGDVAAALAAGHQAADYLLQTEHQAETKMNRDRAGQLACMRHTAVHTACKSAALLGLRATGRRRHNGSMRENEVKTAYRLLKWERDRQAR